MSDAAAAAPAAPPRRRRRLALLARATGYELRKATAFRAGFVVRELLHGLVRPAALIVLFRSVYRAAGVDELRGYTWPELVRYMILVALLRKVLFHARLLDVSRQIFEGYITKYLVMPFDYFVLPLGRFAQFTLLQLGLAALLWGAGALLLPAWWPLPASGAGLAQAAALALLGSYCFFLMYLIVEQLAFWLDVVWSLMVTAGFVTSFAAGEFLPARMMPAALARALPLGFPYWSLNGPIELYTGRLGTPDFLRGLATLLAWAALLELVRRRLWRAGVRRYDGSGM